MTRFDILIPLLCTTDIPSIHMLRYRFSNACLENEIRRRVKLTETYLFFMWRKGKRSIYATDRDNSKL